MTKVNSGYYGLLFVVILSTQLSRETFSRTATEIIATSAISLLIGFLLLLPLSYRGKERLNTFKSTAVAVTICMGLILTVFDAFSYYNLTSQERTEFVPLTIIMFGVAFYSGLLNSNAVKTSGLFISFLLCSILLLIALFNIPELDISNIDKEFNPTSIIRLEEILSVAIIVPAFSIINDGELKPTKTGVVLIAVFVIVAVFSLLAEAVFGNNLDNFAVSINALAIVGELSIFRRLDIILSAFLFLGSCMKISALSNSMAYLLNQKRYYIAIVVSAVVAIVFNLISTTLLATTVGILSIAVTVLFLVPYKRLVKLAVILPLFFMVGCGGTELQERAAVTMTFVDKVDEYKVSLLICTEYEENGPSVSLISGEGETFSSALYDVSKEVNGELYMGQSELIILGKGFVDGGVDELIPQLYETKMTDGNAFIYLTEYDEGIMKEKEGKLLDATDSVLRQSESNRFPSMQLFKLKINDEGKMDGHIPVIDVFEYKGAVATSAVFYKDGEQNLIVDREQLELISALQGDRERVAVVYDYEGKEAVAGLNEIAAEVGYDRGNITIDMECVVDQKLSEQELMEIRESIANRISEIINLSVGHNLDIFNIEEKHKVMIGDVKGVNTMIEFKM